MTDFLVIALASLIGLFGLGAATVSEEAGRDHFFWIGLALVVISACVARFVS